MNWPSALRWSSKSNRWFMLRYRLVPQFDAATLTIRECSDCFCSAFDLSIDAFNGVLVLDSSVQLDSPYMWASLRYFPPLSEQRQTASFRGVVVLQKRLFASWLFAFLGMDGLQHHGDGSYLCSWCDGEYISIEIYCTTLIPGFWKQEKMSAPSSIFDKKYTLNCTKFKLRFTCFD